jgi:hypothetical protein
VFCLTDKPEQLSLIDEIKQVNECTHRNPVKFLELLGENIDIPTLIPHSFRRAYYASRTNHRGYKLESILAILLLMHFFKFANVNNFVTLLLFSPQVQEFCRLNGGDASCPPGQESKIPSRVPDDTVLSKFKITFEGELKLFFENLSLRVIDIFAEYDAALPDNHHHKGLHEILINDTSGLKPKVKENNPKALESEVKKQTAKLKYLENKGLGKDFDVYKAAFAHMPKHAQANEDIKLGYANGHFGYFYKFGMLTNGFGIPLHIYFPDKDFYSNLPKTIDSPEDSKYAFDNASLRPVLSSFYSRIGNRRFSTVLGDSEFESYDNFGYLKDIGFKKVLIPINGRNTPVSNQPIPVNSANIPCCPKDPSTQFIPDGSCKGKNRSLRFKFVCPKSRKADNAWVSDCKDKCRQTNSTVTSYTYPVADFRTFPGIQRGSLEWKDIYKTRSVIERELSSMKSHPALERPNTYNCASMRADVYLNATAKLITVILAFSSGKPDYIRNLKSLLSAA